MLQSFHYRIPLGDKDFEPVAQSIRTLASRLVRIQPRLRGLKLQQEEQHLLVVIRVAGNTRWDISHDAKKLILRLTRAARIRADGITLQQTVTEINGRQLYLGEGRTEMTRRPRTQQQADGRPWDHYEWWGDQLESEGLNPKMSA